MSIKILEGDCRDILATLPDESVHCVVTSPPYWGLRDYGTAEWEGGEAGCDHKIKGHAAREFTDGKGNSLPSNMQTWGERESTAPYRSSCGKCGARRIDRQLGLEATPDEHVAAMVRVFREVKRVLRRDGVLFLNYGDSYFGGARREQPYDKADIERPDSRPSDCSSENLCDGCRAASMASRTSHNGHSRVDERALSLSLSSPAHTALERDHLPTSDSMVPGDRMISAMPDRPPSGQPTQPLLLDAPASTSLESSPPLPGGCSHCANCGACLSVLRSSSRDASLCARRAEYINGSGAGTVGLVADRLQRNAILIELNPAYAEMARKRVVGDAPLLAAVSR